MANVFFNLQFVKTQFASSKEMGNTIKKTNTNDMIAYYERKSACDYTQTDHDDGFSVDTEKAFDYYNYRVGSTGGWGKKGDFQKHDAENLIEKYKPKAMYRMILSFEDSFAEETNIKAKENMKRLINKSMGKVIKNLGFDESNVEWGCYYHTNTDNPHVHVWMFEKKPTKRQLKIKKEQFRRIRSRITNAVALNTELYSVRENEKKELLDAVRNCGLDVETLMATFNNSKKSFKADTQIVKKMIQLEKKLPFKGSLKYNSANMIPYKNEIDEIADMLLSKGEINKHYSKYVELLKKDNELYNKRYYKDTSKYNNQFYENRINQLRTSIGNMIIQNIKGFRKDRESYKLLKESLNIKDSKSKSFSVGRMSKHSIKSRSAILNSGVMAELDRAIYIAMCSINDNEKMVRNMIKVAEGRSDIEA